MLNDEKWPAVATIRATARRAQAEGLGVGEHQLRRWVKTGVLPCLRSGNRQLIRWADLLDLVRAQITDLGGEKKTPCASPSTDSHMGSGAAHFQRTGSGTVYQLPPRSSRGGAVR